MLAPKHATGFERRMASDGEDWIRSMDCWWIGRRAVATSHAIKA